MDGVFTIEKLRTAIAMVREIPTAPGKIIVSEYALKDSNERLFPTSKHRSRRIHKKLVKRFGGEFRKVPASYQTPQGIVMHPTVYAAFQSEMSKRARDSYGNAFTGALIRPTA